MNWDLFGLLDQGEKDEQKRILAEQLAQSAELYACLIIQTRGGARFARPLPWVLPWARSATRLAFCYARRRITNA